MYLYLVTSQKKNKPLCFLRLLKSLEIPRDLASGLVVAIKEFVNKYKDFISKYYCQLRPSWSDLKQSGKRWRRGGDRLQSTVQTLDAAISIAKREVPDQVGFTPTERLEP